jgi:ABC-type phosphate transport system substrate-binding protein
MTMTRAKLHVSYAIALSLAASTAMAEVVPIVSAKSPVMSLSRDQLTDIFLGKVSRFPNGLPAVPIDLAEGSAVRDEFYGRFFGKTSAQIRAFWAKVIFTGRGQPPREVPDGAAMKRLVVENINAIGYVERDMLDASVKVLPPTVVAESFETSKSSLLVSP